MASRHVFVGTFLALLLGVSFYVVIEVSLTGLRVIFPSNQYLPHMHVPLWVDGITFCLSLLMLRFHWVGWKQRRLNADMPQVVESLLRELDRSRPPGATRWTPEARKEFLEKLMLKMKEVLERDKNRKIAFSLMERNDEGKLVIIFVHPLDADFEQDFWLKSDEGGAGAAYTRRNSIYIPSTKHLMAVDVETNEVIGQIYKPDLHGCPFRCVFCVPVFSGLEVVTVLNVSCTKRSSFDLFEFSVGRLMAAIVAMLG